MYGVVKYAYDKTDQSDVYAVKCIERKKIQSERDLHNLQNEIAIMAEIVSPFVVSLKDATKTPNNYYLCMELCNGGDLESFKKLRGGYLKEHEARLIIRQILKGIAAIKEKKVMHRDLKLPNVMLHFSELNNIANITGSKVILREYIKNFDFYYQHESLTCKIADLGFARKLMDNELAMTGCGTPLLMAPEVLGGQHYNHKADVWSIGCIYYELLMGFMPFTGVNIQNLKENLRKGDFKIPKTVQLSLGCIEFLNACL